MSANQGHERAGKAIELAEESDFALGKLLVRPSRREVEADGATDTIEPRVMQVLVALARRRGEVVSREQLTQLCWGGRFVSEDALNRSMTKLRKLAAPDRFALETIPRVGYRLVPAELPEAVPHQAATKSDPPATSAAEPEQGGSTAKPVRRRRWVRWVVGVAALLVLMILVTATGFYFQLSRPYFAVLPFDVIGVDARATTLASSIHGAITTQLRTQGYKVVPRTVTADYVNKVDAMDGLDARYFVHGSVHVDANRMRVIARIDAAGGVSVWSQEFSLDVGDSASGPEHIAMTISALFNPGVRMLFDNPPHVTAAIMRIGSLMRAGDDLGAYVAAREVWRKSPSTRIYANHYALSIGPALDLVPARERWNVLQEGRKALERVMDDPSRGAPMASYMLTPPADWATREGHLRYGIDLPFSDASGLRRLLATQLANSGRLAEALALSEQAIGVDRSSSSNMVAHAYVLDTLGRQREAQAVLDRAARYWAGNEFVERMRFSTALARRDVAAMKALLADPIAGPVLDPPADARPLPAIVRAFETRDTSDIERLEAACADPAKIARERGRFCLHALALLDRLDTFFALAPFYFPEQRGATSEERDARWAADPRMLSNVRVLFRSDTANVRSDARIIPIFERVGLMEYWSESGAWPDFCNGAGCSEWMSNSTQSRREP